MLLLLSMSAAGVEGNQLARPKDNPYDKPYVWPDNQPEDCPFPESDEITGIEFTASPN